MKLHEIEWVDGKEYTIEILGITRNIKIASGDLCDSHSGKLLTDLYSVLGLLDADFKEIVKPVTFIEAYDDCMVNGTTYADKHDTFRIRRAPDGDVELKIVNSTIGHRVVCVGRMEFTKVVD